VARIYISSTYQDLRNERNIAANALRKLEHLARGMEDYAADDRRPVDLCIADVAASDGYIGLIGQRYGWVPPERPEGFSITRLEYQTAGLRGIPRLVFFVDPPDAKPLEPEVAEFRRAIAAELTIKVVDAFSLEAAVIHATMQTFGVGDEVPKLLPYLCDRSDQMLAFREKFLASFGAEGDGRPIVALTHGDEREAHSKFAERVRTRLIPEALRSAAPRSMSVKSFVLSWPSSWGDANAGRQRLLGSLSAELQAPPKEERVVAGLAQIPGLSFLETHVLTEDCRRDGPVTIESFAEFWESLPFGVAPPAMIAMLFVKYARPPRWWPSAMGVGRVNGLMKRVVEGLAKRAFERLRVVVLPELESVRRNQADEWASQEEVRRFAGSDDLEPDIRKIFDTEGTRGEIPMEQLAPSLRKLLLERRARERAGR
jgi:hypothetical protein